MRKTAKGTFGDINQENESFMNPNNEDDKAGDDLKLPEITK